MWNDLPGDNFLESDPNYDLRSKKEKLTLVSLLALARSGLNISFRLAILKSTKKSSSHGTAEHKSQFSGILVIMRKEGFTSKLF